MGVAKPSKPIPYEVITKYVEEDNPDIIISVGSGSGEIESFVERSLNKKVICIDPFPMESLKLGYHGNSCSKVVKSPDYAYLDDYLKNSNPSNKKITLMLMWPPPDFWDSKNPGGLNFDPNTSFDIEAIYKLSPDNIVLLFDVSGTSGSTYLHSWLNIEDKYDVSRHKDLKEHPVYKPPKYHKLAEYTHINPKNSTYTLLLLSLTNRIVNLPEIIEDC